MCTLVCQLKKEWAQRNCEHPVILLHELRQKFTLQTLALTSLALKKLGEGLKVLNY